MKTFCAAICFIANLVIGFAQTITLEMELDSHKIQQGDYMSPVTTYKNNIYTVWIDENKDVVIAKKSNGLITTKTIFASGVPDDPFHVAPSIGIDKNGYIHVAGNMHHSPFNNLDSNPFKDVAWQYWVSDKPEDISSFSFKGDTQQSPPGTWISYPYFQRDSKGNLYVAYRHRVSFNGGWVGGVMAGAVARYNAIDRTWTMLGGTDYKHGIKTLAWTGKPNTTSAYEGYKPRIHVDANDNIHFIAVGVAEAGGAKDGTHTFYAYSNDSGNTWRKSNGEKYTSLPFTKQNGETAFSVNWSTENTSSDQRLYNIAHVGVLSNGRPLASCERNREQYITLKTSDNDWSNPKVLPGNFPSRIITSNNGTIYSVDNEKIHISQDNTNSWTTYDVPLGIEQNAIFDATYLREYNKIRYQGLFRSGENYKIRVYTIDFGFGTINCNSTNPLAGIVPTNISSSNNDSENIECNIMDSDLNTRWSADGDGQWIRFDLGSAKSFDKVAIAFFKGNERTTNFDIQVSDDGNSWANILTNMDSGGTSLDLESFSFPTQNKRYVRYLGHGNSIHNWNSLTEFTISPAFNILNYNPPTNVTPGESYTIEIPYTGDGEADMKISLQNKDDNWVTEGAANVSINGNGTATLKVTVDTDAKPGNNYHWQAYITPIGGNWSNRYDNKLVDYINCNINRTSNIFQGSNQTIRLYPNPVTDELILQLGNSSKKIQSIRIYNLQGRVAKEISKDELKEGTEKLIDVSGITDGMYILSIDFIKKETQNSQFIIKH